MKKRKRLQILKNYLKVKNKMEKSFRLGVVGYCPPTKFNENKAHTYILEAYNKAVCDFSNRIVVVSGLTNVGVLKLAYEEAKRRGWKTAGVACKKAFDYKSSWFPVDQEPVIVGENWGDESFEFIKSIDALVRIGCGKQSLREASMARNLGKKTYEYDLERLS